LITICICDDDGVSRELVKNLCTKMMDEQGLEGRFFEYKNAESFVMGCPSNPDILFLDVIMGKMTGIEAAKEIRKENTAVTIVFMSNYATYAVEGYSVQAYRYLLKPIVGQRFHDEMFDVFERLAMRRRNVFTVKNEQGTFAIDPGKVIYVETSGSKTVCLHTVDGQVNCRDSLKKWDNAFTGMGFFRCHSAYLVNLAYVQEVLANDVLKLSGGETLAVSRHRRAKLIEALAESVSGRL